MLGVAAFGSLLGAMVTKRAAARIEAGWTYTAGCLLFTAPLVLWPLAHGGRWLVLGMLFGAEFGSGFGVMMLDISIGAIFAAVIPDTLRARVTGAFQAVNYGVRPLGGRCSARCSAGCWVDAGAAARAVGGDAGRRGRGRAGAATASAAVPAA